MQRMCGCGLQARDVSGLLWPLASVSRAEGLCAVASAVRMWKHFAARPGGQASHPSERRLLLKVVASRLPCRWKYAWSVAVRWWATDFLHAVVCRRYSDQTSSLFRNS